MMYSVYQGTKLIARVNTPSAEAAIKRVAERTQIQSSELRAEKMNPKDGIKHQ